MFGTKAHMGQASAPLAWVIPIIFGMAIFKGLVIPTGTIFVYDQVLNANQAVGGVPDIVVFLAGGLNELERDIVQVVDTASANPYATSGGMAQFNLIMSSVGAQPDDIDLGRSIQQYYKDCGVWSVNTNFHGVSLQELMRGSSDLAVTFGKFANPALSTVYYTSTNDQGTPVSCSAAWASINGALISGAEMKSMESEICQRSGFSNSSSTQMAQCDTDLSSVGQTFGVAGADSQAFMRSVFLAQSMATALQSGDFALGQSEIMNRQVMTESLGSANAMNEWIPKLRSFMTATVLGLIPLLALFMMTPLSMKALATIMGLFMWLFFWGISDAIAATAVNDAATNAFAQISHYGLGFDSIMNMPEGAVKALGVFGKARAMALGVATLLSSSLMAFGGVALSSISKNLQQDLEGKGERSAGTALLPEQRGAYLQQLSSGIGSEGAVGRYGMTDVAAGGAASTYRNAASARELAINPSLAGGMAGLQDGLGRVDAGSQSGQLSGAAAATTAKGIHDAADAVSRGLPPPAPLSLASTAADKAESDTSSSYGATRAQKDAFAGAGKSMYEGGYLQGGTAAGRQMAFDDIYRNVTGGDRYTAEGFRSMGKLLEGAYEAQSQVTPNPEAYIAQQREFAKKLYAQADFLEKNPGAAEFIGRTGELNNLLQNQGFVDTIHSFGEHGVRQGYAYSGQGQAARGEAAAAAGGTTAVARETGRSGVAQDLAGAHVSEAMVRALGLNPNNVRDLTVGADKRGFSTVSYALDDDTREPTIRGLLANSQITSQQAQEMRDRKETGRATVTLGENGTIRAGSIDGGTQTNYRSTDTSVVGRDSTKIDSQQDISRRTVLQDHSTTLAGGQAVVSTKGAAADFILKGMDGYGNVGESYKTQLASQYAASIAEFGHRAGADTSRVFNSEVASRVGADIGLPLGFARVGAGVSSTESRADQERISASSDAGNLFFRQVIDTAFSQGEKEAARVYGTDFRRSPRAGEANEYVAKFTEEKLRAAHGVLLRSLDQQASEGTTDLQKALKVSPGN